MLLASHLKTLLSKERESVKKVNMSTSCMIIIIYTVTPAFISGKLARGCGRSCSAAPATWAVCAL